MSSQATSKLKPSSAAAHAGGLFFAVLFVCFATFLLSQLTAETKFSANKSLFAQPRFWPGVSVLGMLIFGIGHIWSVRRQRSKALGYELFNWVKSFEYLAWFMIYVLAVPQIGYLLATVLFMLVLTARQGYRQKQYFLIAAIVAFLIVLIFKTLLAVKIPGGAIYEFLPTALRSFMIINF